MKRFFILSIYLLSLIYISDVNAGGVVPYLTIIDHNIKIYKEDDERSSIIDTSNIKLKGESHTLFGESLKISDDGGKWLKVILPNGGDGWVRNDSNKILRNPSQSGAIQALLTGKGKLFKKALVRNRVDLNSISSSVQYYASPDLNHSIGNISIFEVRYIFKTNSDAVLLGRVDRMHNSNSHSVLVGWMAKKFLIEWDNRIGIEFQKDNFKKRKTCNKAPLVKLYKSMKNAKKNRDAIFTEGDSDESLPYYANRYPFLESKTSNMFKIAYIGNAIGNKSYTADEVREERHKINSLIDQNNVDIAVLIDATSGMRKHIINVKKALIKFFKNRENIKKARIAVAVYRDYADGSRLFGIQTDFTRDKDRLQSAIESVKVSSNSADNGVGAFPEAVFNGIKDATNQLSWESEGEKYLLLVGDHGNHTDYSQYGDVTQYTAYEIGEMLKEFKITMFSIQVNLNDPSKKVFNQMFENQVKIINENNGGLGKLQKVKNNSSKAILDAMHSSLQTDSNIKQHLTEIRNFSKSPTNNSRKRSKKASTGALGIYKGQFSQKLLERYNINADIFKAVQLCEVGYVHQKNRCGIKQLVKKVLMGRNDLESLKVNMGTLVEAIADWDPETEDDVRNTIVKVVKALTGDKISDKDNIADFINKKTGIPVKTDFLKTSVSQLVEDMREEKLRGQFLKYLGKKLIGLEEVVKEQRLSNAVWDQESLAWEYDETDEKIPYFFSLEQPLPNRGNEKKKVKSSKMRHVWVPFEYFP
jgi:hypothetical protein